jgi:hypothetical protein
MDTILAETSSSEPDPEWAKLQIEDMDLEATAFDEKSLRSKYLRMFLSSDAIYSSPLTRAVQVRPAAVLFCSQAPKIHAGAKKVWQRNPHRAAATPPSPLRADIGRGRPRWWACAGTRRWRRRG